MQDVPGSLLSASVMLHMPQNNYVVENVWDTIESLLVLGTNNQTHTLFYYKHKTLKQCTQVFSTFFLVIEIHLVHLVWLQKNHIFLKSQNEKSGLFQDLIYQTINRLLLHCFESRSMNLIPKLHAIDLLSMMTNANVTVLSFYIICFIGD